MGRSIRLTVPSIKKLLPDNNGQGRDCDSVTVAGRHCFGARGWYLVVEFQIEFFYTMALDFLDGLKKKKRTVYPMSATFGAGAQVGESPGDDAR